VVHHSAALDGPTNSRPVADVGTYQVDAVERQMAYAGARPVEDAQPVAAVE
jgi:hypothetical protein